MDFDTFMEWVAGSVVAILLACLLVLAYYTMIAEKKFCGYYITGREGKTCVKINWDNWMDDTVYSSSNADECLVFLGKLNAMPSRLPRSANAWPTNSRSIQR